jgi:hypothetical protein
MEYLEEEAREERKRESKQKEQISKRNEKSDEARIKRSGFS